MHKMTKDEEKALQKDNEFFMSDDEINHSQNILWIVSITTIIGLLILIGIFILEVMAL